MLQIGPAGRFENGLKEKKEKFFLFFFFSFFFFLLFLFFFFSFFSFWKHEQYNDKKKEILEALLPLIRREKDHGKIMESRLRILRQNALLCWTHNTVTKDHLELHGQPLGNGEEANGSSSSRWHMNRWLQLSRQRPQQPPHPALQASHELHNGLVLDRRWISPEATQLQSGYSSLQFQGRSIQCHSSALSRSRHPRDLFHLQLATQWLQGLRGVMHPTVECSQLYQEVWYLREDPSASPEQQPPRQQKRSLSIFSPSSWHWCLGAPAGPSQFPHDPPQ